MLRATSKPLISVVMPTFNAEIYIARAIESILGQSFTNFELVIVDDCSTDKTLSIARKYATSDKRIRIVRNEKNLKIAKSLNRAVKISKSDIIARMDADDISDPRRLELQYRVLKLRPKVAVVGANMIVVDEKGEVISKRRYPTESKELKKVLFRYSAFAHPVVMFRKRVFEEFGGYIENVFPVEDLDLWFKIGSKYQFATVPRFLLKYTLYTTSSSHKNLKSIEFLGLKVKLNAIKNLGYRPSLYDVLYNILEYSTIWFMPSRFRIWCFNLLRNNGLI